MIKPWRLLITPDLPGATNMAMDAVLSDRVAAGQSKPILRFYGWRPRCLSLGFHQSPDDIDLEACQHLGIEVVRRPTGGRAVLHAQEYTYSIVIPAGHPILGQSIHQTYLSISAWLVHGLRQMGIDARAERQTNPSGRADKVICFAKAGRNEVVVGDKKLIGSAQRRWPQVVLQHGSILVGREHQELAHLLPVSSDREHRLRHWLQEKTACLSELIDPVPGLIDFAKHMAICWAQEFDCEIEASTLTPAEWHAISNRAGDHKIDAPSPVQDNNQHHTAIRQQMESVG